MDPEERSKIPGMLLTGCWMDLVALLDVLRNIQSEHCDFHIFKDGSVWWATVVEGTGIIHIH